MPDYQRGKVYKITSGDLTYIGSTCEPTLAKRLANHVKCYKLWKAGKGRLTTSFPLIETGQYEITLIELCPCGSKDELTARERFWIESTVCVNKVHPGRTYKEYYEDNKEAISQQNKAYRAANKEDIIEKNKAYYQANQEVLREKKRAYRDANNDEINARRRERREARKSLVNKI